MERPLAFAVHHLNPWGGHDRSVLEVARNLVAGTTYKFTLMRSTGTDWRPLEFYQVKPFFHRPALLLITYYHAVTLLRFAVNKILGRPKPIVHSTGTCSLVADVVQVQFVNSAWQDMLRRFSSVYQLPGSRSGRFCGAPS